VKDKHVKAATWRRTQDVAEYVLGVEGAEGAHRGTRHLQAAEPRRRGGRVREGAHSGTRHLLRLPLGET